MKMLKSSVLAGVLGTTVIAISSSTPLSGSAHAQAAGEADCAIWLCLPQGFAVPGCGPARRAFLRRIPFRPPLPPFPACVVPGTASVGSFEQGREEFEECIDGYVPSFEPILFERGGPEIIDQVGEARTAGRRVCVREASCTNTGVGFPVCTDSYTPGRRADQDYVEVFLDGESQGRFYYTSPEE